MKKRGITDSFVSKFRSSVLILVSCGFLSFLPTIATLASERSAQAPSNATTVNLPDLSDIAKLNETLDSAGEVQRGLYRALMDQHDIAAEPYFRAENVKQMTALRAERDAMHVRAILAFFSATTIPGRVETYCIRGNVDNFRMLDMMLDDDSGINLSSQDLRGLGQEVSTLFRTVCASGGVSPDAIQPNSLSLHLKIFDRIRRFEIHPEHLSSDIVNRDAG